MFSFLHRQKDIIKCTLKFRHDAWWVKLRAATLLFSLLMDIQMSCFIRPTVQTQKIFSLQ